MIVNRNLKHLRLKHELTQKQFAEKLGLKQSVIGAYEEERATPPLNVLLDVSNLFKVSMDVLTRKDLGKLPEREWKATTVAKEVLAITVDASGKENVELVSQKASAGYLAGYQDPEFIAELPKINLPVLPKNRTYRAFEIQGDSMLPVQPGSILFGEYIENLDGIKNGKPYVLVTRQEGIVFKRVFRFSDDAGKLLVVSDNRQYEPYSIASSDILEIWSVRAFYSTKLPEADMPSPLTDQLALHVLQLQEQLKGNKIR
ncbi:MAG: LexA family transcriptional regulator [Cyclobacteriaceae bacterium]|jgi:transcriptional regulator with XRE-family HTH domain|nr:LexA family transcriptional regulator [Cyclobacteriaceae bacterium]